MKLLMLALVLIGGMAVSTQAGVNGLLGKKVGSLEGAFVSFFIGTLSLLFMMIFFGKGNVLHVFSLPKWQLTGGLLGALYVFVMIMAVPKIGVASALIAAITGQIVMSTLIDHYGWITGQQIPINWQRIAGLVLMAGALFLFYKR